MKPRRMAMIKAFDFALYWYAKGVDRLALVLSHHMRVLCRLLDGAEKRRNK
jgi:hypothetical protein